MYDLPFDLRLVGLGHCLGELRDSGQVRVRVPVGIGAGNGSVAGCADASEGDRLYELGRIRRIVPPGGWRVIPGAQKGLWGCVRWLW